MRILVLVLIACVALACMDENGNPVDYFSLLKMPKLRDHSGRFEDGLGYFYMDSNTRNLTVSPTSIGSTSDGAVAHTLSPVYGTDRPNYLYYFYNGQYPHGSSHDSFAHSKGVVVGQKSGGFWLIHSVPAFPPATTDGYGYVDSGRDNGQSFLCLTLDAGELDKVMNLMLLNKVYIYDSNYPSSLESTYPTMAKLLNHEWVREASFKSQQLKTKGGVTFTQFAKSDLLDDQFLYENIVAPHFKTGLVAETWRNGATSNKMPSFCPPSHTFNVSNAAVVGLNPYTWKQTKDHSKWVVSPKEAQVACVGDINRQFSQSHRGGGTVCGHETFFWNAFYQFVRSVDPCGQI